MTYTRRENAGDKSGWQLVRCNNGHWFRQVPIREMGTKAKSPCPWCGLYRVMEGG